MSNTYVDTPVTKIAQAPSIIAHTTQSRYPLGLIFNKKHGILITMIFSITLIIRIADSITDPLVMYLGTKYNKSIVLYKLEKQDAIIIPLSPQNGANMNPPTTIITP